MAHDPKDPKLVPGQRDPDPAAPTEPAEPKRSGRVTFDARGNSVWEWQLETGVYSRDVSTHRLKKLDLGDLSIAETAIQKKPEFPEEPDAGGGFNPYNSAPRSGSNPYDNARTLGRQFRKDQQPVEPPPKPRRPMTPDELRKLSEHIKLKKNLERDKK